MAAAETAIDDPLHPRRSCRLLGHDAAVHTLLGALAQGRLHHAWLLSGPRGVGKATLAYGFARHLLARARAGTTTLFGAGMPPDRFEMAPVDPVFQRIATGSEGNLFVLERGVDPRRGVVRGEIVIDDVRALGRFFAHTAAEPGWRVAIIDSADEMNRSAANALLKILEEPPEKGILLLLAHAPGRLLPTIRSRCRRLVLRPVADDVVHAVLAMYDASLPEADRRALVELARGAPGRAVRLAAENGLAIYRALLAVLDSLPGLDRPAAHRLASELSGKNAETRYRIFVELLLDWLAGLIRAAAAAPGQGETAAAPRTARLAAAQPLDRWVELWEKMGRLVSRAEAVHLDRKQLILSLLTEMDRAARGQFAA